MFTKKKDDRSDEQKFLELESDAGKFRGQVPALRKGQSLFIVAANEFDFVVELGATAVDCFYDDTKIPDFLEAIEARIKTD